MKHEDCGARLSAMLACMVQASVFAAAGHCTRLLDEFIEGDSNRHQEPLGFPIP